jgi:23S rRNA pseudouridine2605 synthase
VSVPLARALSKLGLATRSEAERLIVSGRVRIDGRIADDPSMPVIPERIGISIDGRAVAPPARITLLLHKPRGVVTTRRDPEGRRTVYDLLGDCPPHVVPVGRLDYATSGLLLLTNDTRLADWLTDPAHAVARVYLVTVRGRVSEDERARLEAGITLRGGETLQARAATVRKASNRESHLVLELVEGKNREIRRLLSAIGHEVTRLRRVQFGGLTLGDLAPGAWRTINDDELVRAFPGASFSEKKLPRRRAHR